MEKKIIIYSTRGGEKTLTTSATVWGEVKALIENDYDLSNLIATESINKTNLEHLEARLPEATEFIIFLRPQRMKAGLSDNEKDALQEIVDALEELMFRGESPSTSEKVSPLEKQYKDLLKGFDNISEDELEDNDIDDFVANEKSRLNQFLDDILKH